MAGLDPVILAARLPELFRGGGRESCSEAFHLVESKMIRKMLVPLDHAGRRTARSFRPERRGFISVEFLIFSSLFIVLFAVLLRHLFTLWMQIRTEDQAMILAREAAGMYQDAGTIHFQDVFNGRGTAEIRWDQSNVWVRVELNDARAGAERFLPRETP